MTESSSDNLPWYAPGLSFTCTQCGNCCTGEPGVVWVSDEEIHASPSIADAAWERCSFSIPASWGGGGRYGSMPTGTAHSSTGPRAAARSTPSAPPSAGPGPSGTAIWKVRRRGPLSNRAALAPGTETSSHWTKFNAAPPKLTSDGELHSSSARRNSFAPQCVMACCVARRPRVCDRSHFSSSSGDWAILAFFSDCSEETTHAAPIVGVRAGSAPGVRCPFEMADLAVAAATIARLRL